MSKVLKINEIYFKMDILQPQIVVIGKRRYRKNNNMTCGDVDNKLIAPYREETEDMFYEDSCGQRGYNDEPECGMESDEFKGIEKSGDKFKLVFDLMI